MGKLIDLTGQKFNMLTVIERKLRDVKGVFWLCKCDCGNESVVASSKLKSGHTKSCGCFSKTGAWRDALKSHGLSGTPTYRSWATMKRRCNNKNDISYKRYGAIGISYCETWDKFENFFNDMGLRPEGKTLDRINNKLGYSKENCRWADNSTQCRNQRVRGTSSKYRGVAKTDYGKFQSAITVKGKNIYLGTFKTELEAAEAYQGACLKYVGYTLPMTDSV